MNANPPISIRVKSLSLYLFWLFILYLAGSYLTTYFLFVFYTALLFLLLSLFHLFTAMAAIKYHQEFSSEHPVKGETVSYRLTLSNESSLPIPRLGIRFKSVHPLLEKILPDFYTNLGAQVAVERHYQIQCPYRGVYTVGLEGLKITDLLGFIRLTLPVWYRTFYVYPRLLDLQHFRFSSEKGEPQVQESAGGAVPDYSLFRQLKAYRNGESIRHIAWKRYAGTGVPLIKEYETTAEPGVTIYLDLRRGGYTGRKAMEVEDASIEILVALVKYFLDRGVTTAIRAVGRSYYSFRVDSTDSFQNFYTSTFELIFQEAAALAAIYQSERKSGVLEAPAVLFITHLLDSSLFELVEQTSLEHQGAIIFNQTGYSQDDRERNVTLFNRLRDQGGNILVVNDSHSIVEDLERYRP